MAKKRDRKEKHLGANLTGVAPPSNNRNYTTAEKFYLFEIPGIPGILGICKPSLRKI